MYCNKCGAEISDRAFFCKHCGNMMREIGIKQKGNSSNREEENEVRSSTITSRLNRIAEDLEADLAKYENMKPKGDMLDEDMLENDISEEKNDVEEQEDSTYEKLLKDQQEKAKLKVEMTLAKVQRATETIEKAKNKDNKPSYENMSLSEAIIEDEPVEEDEPFLAEEPDGLLAEEQTDYPLVEESVSLGTSLGEEIRKAEFKAEKRQNKKEKRSERKSKKEAMTEESGGRNNFLADDEKEATSFIVDTQPVVQEEQDTNIEGNIFQEKVSKEEVTEQISLFEEEKQEIEEKTDTFGIREEIKNNRKNEVEMERDAAADAARRASRRVPIRAEIRTPLSSPVVVDSVETNDKKEKIVEDLVDLPLDIEEEKKDTPKKILSRHDKSYPIFAKITVGSVIVSIILSILLFLSISGFTMVCSIRQSVMTENVKRMTQKLELQDRFKGTYIGELIDFEYLTQIVSHNISGIMVITFVVIILYMVALLLRINIANQKLVLLYGALPCIISGSILYEASANYEKFYLSLSKLFNLPEDIVIILCELVSTTLGKISLFVVIAGIAMCALLVVLIIIEVAKTPDRAGNQDRMDRVFGN